MEGGVGNPSALKSSFNELQETLKGMEQGQMKPNQALLDQMKDISPESIKSLSSEQIQQLKEKLQDSSKKLDSDCESGECKKKPGDGKRLPKDGEGNCNSPGICDGPGHDEYLYGDTHERLKAGSEGGLTAQDLTDFTPGDLLELQSGAPTANQDVQGVRASGGVSIKGKGGNRVWRQALLPAEQKAVKSFFTNTTNDE